MKTLEKEKKGPCFNVNGLSKGLDVLLLPIVIFTVITVPSRSTSNFRRCGLDTVSIWLDATPRDAL